MGFKMRSSYMVVLESDLKSGFIKTIEFVGSYYQAMRVFDSLSFALCCSDYTALTLFRNDEQIKKINYKR